MIAAVLISCFLVPLVLVMGGASASAAPGPWRALLVERVDFIPGFGESGACAGRVRTTALLDAPALSYEVTCSAPSVLLDNSDYSLNFNGSSVAVGNFVAPSWYSLGSTVTYSGIYAVNPSAPPTSWTITWAGVEWARGTFPVLTWDSGSSSPCAVEILAAQITNRPESGSVSRAVLVTYKVRVNRLGESGDRFYLYGQPVFTRSWGAGGVSPADDYPLEFGYPYVLPSGSPIAPTAPGVYEFTMQRNTSIYWNGFVPTRSDSGWDIGRMYAGWMGPGNYYPNPVLLSASGMTPVGNPAQPAREPSDVCGMWMTDLLAFTTVDAPFPTEAPDDPSPTVAPIPDAPGSETEGLGWIAALLSKLLGLIGSLVSAVAGLAAQIAAAIADALSGLVDLVLDGIHALFVPSPGALEDAQQEVQAAWDGAAPGQYLNAFSTSLSSWSATSTGCGGPSVDIPPIGVEEFSPLNACSAPMSGVASTVKTLLTIGVYLGAAVVCARILASSFGFQLKLGGGAASES